ncbi:MAG: peptidoglycan DD-metalloendopeptidase family protein [Comamonadaceae bacterium]
MFGFGARLSSVLAMLVAAAMLAGCGSKMINRAPVEERGAAVGRATPGVVVETPSQAVKQPPGFENAGKPGYYTVKPGDTLIRIGLDHGQGVKDIARWSGVDNPNRIEVGQVLRVEPPLVSGVVTKPVTLANVTPIANANATAPVRSASADKQPATVAPTAAASAAATVAANADEEMGWIWPTNGAVLAGFDEIKNKGLDIGGSAGDPVLAAADGRVVYVGAGLRGYGNLIILKHNNTYLSAYAHNQTLLIKEDQSVRKGQKIAEMGSSDTDRVKLHFEVRRQGKPVDPVKYLPVR